ncbi:hypothetical protein C8J57DRAFT_1518069 [Mycena rebaudengoi]|nr:hypothetical protein C8J57DRAFT_1518069 [Mycena rebaudengoi]
MNNINARPVSFSSTLPLFKNNSRQQRVLQDCASGAKQRQPLLTGFMRDAAPAPHGAVPESEKQHVSGSPTGVALVEAIKRPVRQARMAMSRWKRMAQALQSAEDLYAPQHNSFASPRALGTRYQSPQWLLLLPTICKSSDP